MTLSTPSSSRKIPCTIGILTYNSSATLARALESAKEFDELLIADGGSTDATLSIAKQYGCRVVSQSRPGKPIDDFAKEKNRLLDAATHDWFFCLDSDEYLSPELVSELRVICSEQNPQHLIYNVPWKVVSADLRTVYRSFKKYYQYRFFNRRSGARFIRKIHERVVFDTKQYVPGKLSGAWLVPLDEQLNFPIYKGKIDHRARVMVAERPPTSFLSYVNRASIAPIRNSTKQIIKFIWLRIRYPWNELPPARYELYKLYAQIVFVKEATRQYGIHLTQQAKVLLYIFAYTLRSLYRLINRRPEVVVLMYHGINTEKSKLSVTPESFERQMAFLAKHMHPVSLHEVVEYVQGKRTLLDKSVAVTFDDGYEDFLIYAAPVFRAYHVPVTLFVPGLDSVETDAAGSPRLTWDALRELEKDELVSIEVHGLSHRPLPSLAQKELVLEVVGARDAYTNELGHAPHYFAYPYGARNDAAEKLVKETYKAGFSITEGLVRPHSSITAIRRTQIDGTMGYTLFRLRLTGAVSVVRWIMGSLRGKA